MTNCFWEDLQVVTSFFSRVALTLVIVGASSVLMSETSSAQQSGTGKITSYDLNWEVPGRGACVMTTPAWPNTGWACIESPGLYKELNELLLQAYINGKTCTIRWNTTDNFGYFIIIEAFCA
jgi:hypothetical protein